MRKILLLTAVLFSLTSFGQPGFLSNNSYNSAAQGPLTILQSINQPPKKWFITRSTALSTSFLFSGRGTATVFAVPVGIQLNRRINNNLFAFGGLSAAPMYISTNGSFIHPAQGLSNSGFMRQATGLGGFARAELGLMYINDARTFSVSGSFGVEQSAYPAFGQSKTNLPTPPPPARVPQKF